MSDGQNGTTLRAARLRGLARGLFMIVVVLYFLLYLPFMFFVLTFKGWLGASGGWLIGIVWFAGPGLLLTVILVARHAPRAMIRPLLVATIVLSVPLAVIVARISPPDVGRIRSTLDDIFPAEAFTLRDESSQGGCWYGEEHCPEVSRGYSSALRVNTTLEFVVSSLEHRGYEIGDVAEDVIWGKSPDGKYYLEIEARWASRANEWAEQEPAWVHVVATGDGPDF